MENDTNESMTIGKALFSFEGRLCRSDYWLKGVLILIPFSIMNNILIHGLKMREAGMIIALIMLWPSLAILIKRLHDRNRSGWFIFIIFIPVIGGIWLLVEVWFLKGTDGPNRFGRDYLQAAETVPVIGEQKIG
jgi:uncharacterized membrane protein YhaH (DUF805 family)